MTPDEKPNQILIIGPPRSGTSLLQSLVATCFEDCWMPPEFEQRPSNYFWERVWPRLKPKPKTIVWKVPEMPWKLKESFDKLVKEGAYVIATMRHPCAMLTSKQMGKPYWQQLAYGMDPNGALERWMTMAAHIQKFAQGIDIDRARFSMFKFETLLTEPNRVQHVLANRIPFLTPTTPFDQAYLHMDARHPNHKPMNGIRPLDPTRAEIPSFEELDELGYSVPDAVLQMATMMGYEYTPRVVLDEVVELGHVQGVPYAYGRGKIDPEWAFYVSPAAENQLDLAPLLEAVVEMTHGDEADQPYTTEGSCPFPQHDHPIHYRGRGKSRLLVGRCPETWDYAMILVGPKGAGEIRKLPEAPESEASEESSE